MPNNDYNQVRVGTQIATNLPTAPNRQIGVLCRVVALSEDSIEVAYPKLTGITFHLTPREFLDQDWFIATQPGCCHLYGVRVPFDLPDGTYLSISAPVDRGVESETRKEGTESIPKLEWPHPFLARVVGYLDSRTTHEKRLGVVNSISGKLGYEHGAITNIPVSEVTRAADLIVELDPKAQSYFQEFTTKKEETTMKTWNALAASIHADNVAAGWWTDPKTGADLHETRDRLNLSMLIITELTEAADANLHDLMDDKLPQYKGVGVELADAQIRILDRMGADMGLVPCEDFLVRPEVYTRSASTEPTTEFDHRFMRMVWFISRSAESDRKNRTSEALFHLTGCLNYIECLGNHMGFDMHELREAKREFNRNRADHKMENRQAEGGKKF